jgi:hypothetical protein
VFFRLPECAKAGFVWCRRCPVVGFAVPDAARVLDDGCDLVVELIIIRLFSFKIYYYFIYII